MEDLMLKIGEKLIKDAIMNHLLTNRMINRTQHGFMPQKSTVSNLIEYLDDITKMLENGDSVSVLMTDFSKCFDKLSKKLIVYCLEERYSIEGNLLLLIKNWLNGRKQCVVLNGSMSEWIEVKSGCLQGSILGPIIALCLLGTIDEHIRYAQCVKFADDNKVYSKVNNIEDQKLMQNDINMIIKWAQDWGFYLNVDKCRILQFGGKEDFNYHMYNIIVKKENKAKDLGVIVDNKLQWHDQIQSTVSKAKRRAFAYQERLSLKV